MKIYSGKEINSFRKKFGDHDELMHWGANIGIGILLGLLAYGIYVGI